MLKKINTWERMIAAGIAFTMLLLLIRYLRSGQFAYFFYVWNTFLAVIPLILSKNLSGCTNLKTKAIALLCSWLVLWPNAPYIITDIFHFHERPPVPIWFDLLLVISAAWNGLVLGIVSLMQVEQFLHKHIRKNIVYLAIAFCILLCGYGVYIGRFVRFNSWNIITAPDEIVDTIASHVLRPLHYVHVWSFTCLFAAMFGMIYFTIKTLPRLQERGNAS